MHYQRLTTELQHVMLSAGDSSQTTVKNWNSITYVNQNLNYFKNLIHPQITKRQIT